MSVKSKNIHVLPTDKPSNGYILGKCIKELSDVKIGQLVKTYYLMFDEEYFKPQNIYITSDEEIKEGDWFMSDFNSFPIHNIKELSEREGTLGWEQKDLKNNLKIILTTDQDLIKDGVQAIDDEFLEWFVNNPSCIRVGVDKLYDYPSIAMMGYKIIIPKEDWLLNNPQCKQIESCSKSLSKKCICPKEEAKQNCEFCKQPISKYGCACAKQKEEPKQETLEEAATNYTIDFATMSAFKLGAKWQQEQMYSELAKLRNELYEQLPTGKSNAFDLIKIINNHINKIDELI